MSLKVLALGFPVIIYAHKKKIPSIMLQYLRIIPVLDLISGRLYILIVFQFYKKCRLIRKL